MGHDEARSPRPQKIMLKYPTRQDMGDHTGNYVQRFAEPRASRFTPSGRPTTTKWSTSTSLVGRPSTFSTRIAVALRPIPPRGV
jgi:hypothetical protein